MPRWRTPGWILRCAQNDNRERLSRNDAEAVEPLVPKRLTFGRSTLQCFRFHRSFESLLQRSG
jgi:hypothetical protein